MRRTALLLVTLALVLAVPARLSPQAQPPVVPAALIEVALLLDDTHPATDRIRGYRWVMDGVPSSTWAPPTPCVSCVEKVYQLPPGTHTLVVTPYNDTGTLVPLTIAVEITHSATATSTRTGVDLKEPAAQGQAQAQAQGRGQAPRPAREVVGPERRRRLGERGNLRELLDRLRERR